VGKIGKAHFFFFLLLGISFLFLTFSLQNKIESFKNFFLYLLSPSTSLATKIFTQTSDLGKNLLEQVHLNEENRLLKGRLQEYIHRETINKEILEENKRLRQLLIYKEKKEYNFIPAHVIGRDPQSWYHSVIIDKGSVDGIKKDLPVIALDEDKEGVVGRIHEVSLHSSKVLLITDSLSAVVGSCQRNNVDGLVEGQNKNELLLKYLFPDADVRIKDLIVTNGIGGVFPPGLPIGEVIKIEEKKYAPYKQALVSPYLNFHRLRELLILVERK